MKRKRLIYDIETSPNIGFFWQPGYKLNIGYQNIIKERAIICISYKWEGKKVQHLTWDKNQSDEKMLKEFCKLLIEADESIAHNGDQFDLKWIRGRAIKFGIELPPDILTVDTLKLARSKFRFNSNRLDYLAQYLDVGGKIDTGGFGLWKDIVLNKDKNALKKMVKYCDNDVIILEKVWQKLKPYVPAKTSVAPNRIKCPECKGDCTISKSRVLASGAKQTQLQCKGCGKYHTIPTSIYEKSN